MIRAEWMINMIAGPVVGTADRAHITAAWEAVEAAFKDAVGEPWSAVHAAALKRLEHHIKAEAMLDLANAAGRVEYKVPGVTVVLTRTDPPQ